MRFKLPDIKKISPSLVLIAAFALFFFLVPHVSHASDCAAVDIPCWIVTAQGYVWAGVFNIIEAILVFLLYIAGFILDNVFIYNIVLNPINMPAVRDGWLVLRDIANGLFLIILLWIAIQII